MALSRRVAAVPLVLGVVALPFPAVAQHGAQGGPERFTLPQVLSAPFATELVASPDGRRIAWLGDVEGRRNVYVAEAPGWAGDPPGAATGCAGAPGPAGGEAGTCARTAAGSGQATRTAATRTMARGMNGTAIG